MTVKHHTRHGDRAYKSCISLTLSLIHEYNTKHTSHIFVLIHLVNPKHNSLSCNFHISPNSMYMYHYTTHALQVFTSILDHFFPYLLIDIQTQNNKTQSIIQNLSYVLHCFCIISIILLLRYDCVHFLALLLVEIIHHLYKTCHRSALHSPFYFQPHFLFVKTVFIIFYSSMYMLCSNYYKIRVSVYTDSHCRSHLLYMSSLYT